MNPAPQWTDPRLPRYDASTSKEAGLGGPDSKGATAAPHQDSGFSFSNTVLRGGMAPVMTGLCGASKDAPVPLPGPPTCTALSPRLGGWGGGTQTVRKGAIMADIAIATPDLAIIEGQITTTSQQVAQHFGKRHADVIRAIRTLDAPAEFTERNFALSEFTDTTGRKLPAYRITRDGFTLLAMGFTGKEAMQWKVAYLNAFNQMEAQLLAMQSPALPATISPAQRQHLHELVQLIVESGKQGHGETWKRFHNKFRVSKYEHLPASRFEEAVAYLKGKLDAETTVQLISKHLAERMPAAIEMALAAAGGVFTETIKAVLTNPHGPSVIRVLAAADYVPGKGMVPTATPLELDAYALPFAQMANVVSQSEGGRINEADLVSMISACSGQLATRHQQRLAA